MKVIILKTTCICQILEKCFISEVHIFERHGFLYNSSLFGNVKKKQKPHKKEEKKTKKKRRKVTAKRLKSHCLTKWHGAFWDCYVKA